MRIASLVVSLFLIATTACSEDEGGGGSGGDTRTSGGDTTMTGGDTLNTGGDEASAAGDTTLPPGDTGTPVNGTITVAATCPAFSACGGAVLGVWHYSEACYVDSEVFGDIYEACPAASVSNVSASALVGTVVFTSNVVARELSGNITLDVNIPVSCAAVGCAVVQTALNDYAGLSATCSNGAASSCDCNITIPVSESSSDTYMIVGNTITLGGGETFSYCVNGSDLDYIETTPDADPGRYTLTR